MFLKEHFSYKFVCTFIGIGASIRELARYVEVDR